MLFLAALVLGIVWQLPYGKLILYPVTLLATYAHEMGHGLTAMVLGQNFSQLHLNQNGSGMAIWHGNPGRITLALIAAGGLVGPAIAGSALLMFTRSSRYARTLLVILAAILLISAVIWVRNVFGIVFLIMWAGALGLGAKLLTDRLASLLLNMISLALCLALLSDINYMFSEQAVVNGIVYPSDSSAIAKALWLPYWFWGALVAFFSFSVTIIGIRMATRRSIQ